jgi:hypothetical protein
MGNKMKTTFSKHNMIFAMLLSIVLALQLIPSMGNTWAQERGLVIPEPADVPPPANATSPGNITEDNSKTSSPDMPVNKTIEVPSTPNATQFESPQFNNTANRSDS